MSNQTYQLIIKAFSVGTLLQTLCFYSTLFLIVHVIIAQLKVTSPKMPVELVQSKDEEAMLQ